MDVLYGLTKDFVFKEAVAFLKGKRTLTSEEYKMLSRCQDIQVLKSFRSFLTA